MVDKIDTQKALIRRVLVPMLVLGSFLWGGWPLLPYGIVAGTLLWCVARLSNHLMLLKVAIWVSLIVGLSPMVDGVMTLNDPLIIALVLSYSLLFFNHWRVANVKRNNSDIGKDKKMLLFQQEMNRKNIELINYAAQNGRWSRYGRTDSRK